MNEEVLLSEVDTEWLYDLVAEKLTTLEHTKPSDVLYIADIQNAKDELYPLLNKLEIILGFKNVS